MIHVVIDFLSLNYYYVVFVRIDTDNYFVLYKITLIYRIKDQTLAKASVCVVLVLKQELSIRLYPV